MKFVDYESSHITPQKTLLKKFNETLKFLREKTQSWISFYLHTITLNDEKIIYMIDMDSSEITSLQEFYLHYQNSLSCKINLTTTDAIQSYADIVRVLYVGVGTPQLFVIHMNANTLNFVNHGITSVSDNVEEL